MRAREKEKSPTLPLRLSSASSSASSLLLSRGGDRSTEDDLESLKSSVTDEELRSLHDVCEGRVERKDSLVTDAKFDRILASLQSLASELEKDFVTTEEDEEAKDGDNKPDEEERHEGTMSSSSATLCQSR